MHRLRSLVLSALLVLAACGRSGGSTPDTDSVLTLRNVDSAGLAIVWVDVTDADGYTRRIPTIEGVLTLPGMGEDSELRVHHMPPGTYTLEVQWKSWLGTTQGSGLNHPDPVTFSFVGEDVVLELEYVPEP